MLSFLKNHPFAVEAFFERSIVLTFAIPKAELMDKIPPCLDLQTFQDKWAFVAVAMVQTKNLRPKGFPTWMGNDFFLIGYRIFVHFTNAKGIKRSGLYILKSQTNQKKMELLGSLFTHYQYSTTDILFEQNKEKEMFISSKKSNFYVHLKANQNDTPTPLPIQSPFSTWKEARRFAGPLPFTFSYLEKEDKVLIIKGMRQNWKPQAIEIVEQDFQFFEQLGIQEKYLANAFIIQNIPYHWKKGQLDTWKP